MPINFHEYVNLLVIVEMCNTSWLSIYFLVFVVSVVIVVSVSVVEIDDEIFIVDCSLDTWMYVNSIRKQEECLEGLDDYDEMNEQ